MKLFKYTNDFLSIGAFADYYQMSDADAFKVINEGRELHNAFFEVGVNNYA